MPDHVVRVGDRVKKFRLEPIKELIVSFELGLEGRRFLIPHAECLAALDDFIYLERETSDPLKIPK